MNESTNTEINKPNIAEGLALLRKPFQKHQISLLPKPTKKDNPKGKCKECGGWHGLPAVHLAYVGHAALTDRLLDADPNWSWEPLAFENGLPAFDKNGGLWIKLTVCGVTRLGYGNAEGSEYKEVGNREKEVIGDALRNAAMRFGAALDLWHKGNLHLDETVTTDDGVEIKSESAEQPDKQITPPVTGNIDPVLKKVGSSFLPGGEFKDEKIADVWAKKRVRAIAYADKIVSKIKSGEHLPEPMIKFVDYGKLAGFYSEVSK